MEVFCGKLLIFLSVLLELLKRRRPDGVVRTEERQGVHQGVRDVLKSLEQNNKLSQTLVSQNFCN